jgi:hypothetical protein
MDGQGGKKSEEENGGIKSYISKFGDTWFR